VSADPGNVVRQLWRRILWNLVWPRRHERIQPTISGVVLIGLSFGIGTAAYNSASNILFIALALLLACLILSGVLAWLNLRGLEWKLEVEPPLRAGQRAEVGLLLRNGKAFMPTYALWFDFAAGPVDRGAPARPESTITAKGIDVWAALRKPEAPRASGTVHMRSRLEPGGTSRLEWTFTPAKRGILRVELRGVGSLFPFGFLRKFAGTDLRRDIPVWPAPVEYRRFSAATPRRQGSELSLARAGNEGEMIALRQYASGDSHRLIHWKASARSRELLIRQFSSLNSDACSIWLRTDSTVWDRPEQFELLMSFVATLAQDLFRAGRLRSAAIDSGRHYATKRIADLDSFLDRLAEAQPRAIATDTPGSPPAPGNARSNMITFEPDGTRGVAAFINGTKIAAT
jgi:uncharacterized protein (DUF58 family)